MGPRQAPRAHDLSAPRPATAAGGAAATATITEGAATVWAAGAFVAGTPGVFAGAATPDGRAVAFDVGSGTFAFAVTSA